MPKLPLPKFFKRGSSPKARTSKGNIRPIPFLMPGSQRSAGKFFKPMTPFTSGVSGSSVGNANYGPLPSFTNDSQHVKTYNNPSLSNVSEQLSRVLVSIGSIADVLKKQLEFQKYEYKEKARIHRENASERLKSLYNSSNLSGLDISALLAALTGLIGVVQNQNGGSGDEGSGIPPVVPGGGGGGGSPAKGGKPRPFVSKKEALNKNGTLKKGYEEIKNKAGRTVAYRKALPVAKPSAAPKPTGKPKISASAGKGFGFFGKVLGPVTVGIAAYGAYKDIQAIPDNAPTEEKRKRVSSIVGKLVGEIGLMWAGAALGTAVGTAVLPGPGTLVGLLSGLSGSLAASYFFGDDVDEIVDNIVNKLFPDSKEEKKIVPKTNKAVKKASNESKPSTVVNTKKTSITASTNSKKSGITVGQLIDSTANKVGVSPEELLKVLSHLNPSLNLSKTIGEVTGSQIINLDPSQWNQSSRYSDAFPELNAGKTDPKATAMAAAVLLKETFDFLDKNAIEPTDENIISTFLLGDDGLTTLMNADPSAPVNTIVPRSFSREPKSFVDQQNKPLSTSDFLQRNYGIESNNNRQMILPSSASSIPTSPSSENSTSPAATTSPITSSTPTTETSSTSTSTPSQTQSSPTSDAVPVNNNRQAIGEDIMTTSDNIDDIETTGSEDNVQVITTGESVNKSTPSGQSTGSVGTGDVPDPTFSLSPEIENNIFFSSSIILPAYAGARA